MSVAATAYILSLPESERQTLLNEREQEIIELVVWGFKDEEIADRLGITKATFDRHLAEIFDKLGVSDHLELIIYAYTTVAIASSF
ncbi:MAG: hypothetical protein H0W99_01565 [Acidobacteria bacterium]|nr:hypothetical protein [Acidobacteriota bacterium]